MAGVLQSSGTLTLGLHSQVFALSLDKKVVITMRILYLHLTSFLPSTLFLDRVVNTFELVVNSLPHPLHPDDPWGAL